MNSLVILVDDKDQEIGQEDKKIAHQKGKKHRAFSIIIFNSKGEMLIQKRAANKYHSGGLWSNTCCSHPRPGFPTLDEAQLRLNEEMGFTCAIKEIFHFSYETRFNSNMFENEIDHVFLGKYNGEVKINLEETSEYKWMSLNKLKEDMTNNPEHYTFWFKLIINKYANLICG